MKKAKYTAKVIKREFVILSSDGNELQVQPTSEEKLLDAIYGEKYMGVELYTDCGTICANTLSGLNEAAWKLNDEKGLGGDIETFILKNALK